MIFDIIISLPNTFIIKLELLKEIYLLGIYTNITDLKTLLEQPFPYPRSHYIFSRFPQYFLRSHKNTNNKQLNYALHFALNFRRKKSHMQVLYYWVLILLNIKCVQNFLVLLYLTFLIQGIYDVQKLLTSVFVICGT